MLRPIYTEPENCQDCYKCVRECPVKAISVADNRASIIEERCLFCGHCTQICPTGAKKVRDGLTRARMTVERHSEVWLSLAPSYVSEFPGISQAQMAASIRKLGFRGVSETALGAELVSARTDELLEGYGPGLYFSSACPVAVSYISKYASSYKGRITPVMSPMLAHALMLRKLYGDDIKVIFAGPCIAKKLEADKRSDLIDVAITFGDLRQWFEAEDIDPAQETEDGEGFMPYSSRNGAKYPVEGGMLEGLHKRRENIRYMSFSDIKTIEDIFKNLDVEGNQDTIFLELLACRGGCVNGPAKLTALSPAVKRGRVFSNAKTGDPVNDFPDLDLTADYSAEEEFRESTYTEKEIQNALAAVGKTSISDELNCSGCGYDSCRDFAVAMLNGRAEENMCVSYMRRIAHDKATVLLHKIPAGVVMVNDRMQVVDMNRTFAAAMGEDTLAVYEAKPGMEGAAMDKITEYGNLFRTVLITGEEIPEQRITIGDKTYLLSIHNIHPQHLVFGLIQNLHEPTIHKEWVLEKTSDVIRKHMATVQEVARILGENAAFTDYTLRSVIDSLDDSQIKKKKRY